MKIRGRYIITYSGLVFYDNKSWNQTSTADIKALSPFAKVMKNLPGVDYYVSIPKFRNFWNVETINITKRLEIDGRLVAAVGFEIELENFRQEVFQSSPVSSETMLIDENGYVIAMAPYHIASSFIGKDHPFLLSELEYKGIFLRRLHIECINQCFKKEEEEEVDVLISSGAGLVSFLSRLLLLLLHLALHVWDVARADIKLHPPVHAPGSLRDQYNFPSKGQGFSSQAIRTVECCQKYTHFERNFAIHIPEDLIIEGSCGCVARFRVSDVPRTNLLMVVHETPNCRCSIVRPFYLEKGDRTIVHTACYNSTHKHFFEPSKTCVKERGNQTEGMCSRVLLHHSSFSLLAISILVLLGFG